MNDTITKKQYEEICTNFLDSINYRLPSHTSDVSLYDAVTDLIRGHGIEPQKATSIARTGTAAAEFFYPLHPRATKLEIATFTALFFVTEDLTESCLDGLKNFRQNLVLGNPQPRVLQSWLDSNRRLDAHYPQFSVDRITHGMMSYVSSVTIEKLVPESFFSPGVCGGCGGSNDIKAPQFPRYFRGMTGIPDVFAYFILTDELYSLSRLTRLTFMAPDLNDFTNGVNDLLSFYKESVVGDETGNFVHQEAFVRDTGISTVLERLAEDIVKRIENILDTASRDVVLLEFTEAYIMGYIAFHLREPRYRFSELDIPCLQLC
ncbi:uncharacterized protein KD926_004892 [Aspergillus affinis]|uniref:uncharacterized protein n=1 Tax=Aspergillus affinis TaxID=1070780 RepID=UPI0022FDFD08|nr:uncharacterized protein KD926_004892 [Aspergillus affinis]KAI9042827.1 hypothetical protein KD926_004892 [Aspergillus affinis]